MNVASIRQHFIDELAAGNFTVARDGSKTIELIGASFVADEEAIFGEPCHSYIEAELAWYNKQSRNINDIYGPQREPPKAWQMSANMHGEINSNYGYLIFNAANGNQFNNVLEELAKNPNSRRASMVYQRPSIWDDYNCNGKNDFICTNAVTYYIRDGVVHCVVQMRSNDVVFGYKNDYAWQEYVLERLVDSLNRYGNNYATGTITWQVQNLHVYERHFKLVR